MGRCVVKETVLVVSLYPLGGLTINICVRLEFLCTNNQAEYESLM
jgi:hypothetical protein